MTLPNLINTDAAAGLVRARLLAVSEIVAVVGARIVGPNVDDYLTIDKPAIAIEVAQGGRTDHSGTVGSVQIRIATLSMVSSGAARELYAIVRQALQAELLESTEDAHRGTIRETSLGFDGYFDAAKCWAVTGVWTMHVVRDRP